MAHWQPEWVPRWQEGCALPPPPPLAGPARRGSEALSHLPPCLHVVPICAGPALRGHFLEPCLKASAELEAGNRHQLTGQYFFLPPFLFIYLFNFFFLLALPASTVLPLGPFETENTLLACERSRSSRPLYLESQDVIPPLEIFIVPCTPPTHTRTHACVWKCLSILARGVGLGGFKGGAEQQQQCCPKRKASLRMWAVGLARLPGHRDGSYDTVQFEGLSLWHSS